MMGIRTYVVLVIGRLEHFDEPFQLRPVLPPREVGNHEVGHLGVVEHVRERLQDSGPRDDVPFRAVESQGHDRGVDVGVVVARAPLLCS